MELRRRHLTEAADLRALAHPVRIELLDLIASSGPHTASEAAAVLGQTPANVSWHLRKLGEHGFVEQDTSGPGRKRPWRMVAQAHSWGEDAEDRAAAAALRDVIVEREIELMRAAMRRHDDEPEEWRAATNFNQYHLWLTPSEARQLNAEMFEPLMRFAHRSEDPEARPAGSRLMSIMSWVVPYEPTRTPQGKRGEPAS